MSYDVFPPNFLLESVRMGWQPACGGALVLRSRARAGSLGSACSSELRAALIWQQLLFSLLGKAVCGLTA